MDIKIPFESIVEFKTKVFEITKMSLEHEYTINDEYILGNFIVSGDYKSHEICINKDEFSFVLPFQVEILNNIDTTTIEFDIEDFTYELIDNIKLKINIEYSIKGTLKKIEYERIEDEMILEDIDLSELCELEEDIKTDNIEQQMIDEEEKEDEKTIVEKEKGAPMKNDNREITEEIKNDILSNVKIEEEDYITYHIHIVKEGENIEGISNHYKVNSTIISEYNEISEINVGDKILIPFDNE